MRDKIFLIGPMDMGNIPTNGVTMKNQLFYKRFNELFDTVKYIDTWNISQKPWRIVKILSALLYHKDYKFIVSGGHSSRFIFNFIYYLHIKRNIYYWVAGGNLANAIKDKLYEPKVLNNLNSLLVQGISMREELYSLGIKNVVYVPNSKPIIYRPNTNKFKLSHIIKFVFVSRIHPDKGCDDIFNAVQMLNDRGYSDRFEVSFWGPVFPSYKESFNTQLQEYKNVNYCGFLDFTCVNGYDILSNYDIMLFPSYWSGEGFPGVIIDAYIAGLPIIASDWNLNQEVIENEKTGFIIRTKDVQGLYNAMLNCIEGRVDILTMRRFCVKYAEKFDYRNVISIKLLNSIGIK